MYEDFNPADIGKQPFPSKAQLRKEGMTLDEFGKDTSHNLYGKKRPEHSKLMSKVMVGKNKGNKRPDVVERNKHYKHSEEVRQKISENHADVNGEKNPMFGKRHKKKTIKVMSENRKGKGRQPKSAETKAKMSLARKKYWENRRAN
tara:strand:+ start:924 stop:1361 length:438 start_codon:yes stop_codon:yes gene_type:complete